MTITMDKKIIFSNIDEWKEFCKYANSHLRWTNPRLADSFEACQFNEYRKGCLANNKSQRNSFCRLPIYWN